MLSALASNAFIYEVKGKKEMSSEDLSPQAIGHAVLSPETEMNASEGSCPVGRLCSTTYWIRVVTFGIVMLGAVAYGAITVKPELLNYVPDEMLGGMQEVCPRSASCSAGSREGSPMTLVHVSGEMDSCKSDGASPCCSANTGVP